MERRRRPSRAEQLDEEAKMWLNEHIDQISTERPVNPEEEIASGDALDVGDPNAAVERNALVAEEVSSEERWG